jgi:hypothetical protein
MSGIDLGNSDGRVGHNFNCPSEATMRLPLSRRSAVAAMTGLSIGSAFGSRTAIGRTKAATKPPMFDARTFGAAGDGLTDDTSAFRALHKAMRQAQLADDAARAVEPGRPPVEFLVQLPPGHYRYTWNRWTWGIRRITVFGYGAVIQCMHGGPYHVDQAPLIGNRDHYWTWDPDGPAYGGPPPLKEDYGRLIRTARPGDTTVTLASMHDRAGLSPGTVSTGTQPLATLTYALLGKADMLLGGSRWGFLRAFLAFNIVLFVGFSFLVSRIAAHLTVVRYRRAASEPGRPHCREQLPAVPRLHLWAGDRDLPPAVRTEAPCLGVLQNFIRRRSAHRLGCPTLSS